ncbi:g6763 [Coccomyxa elongata]
MLPAEGEPLSSEKAHDVHEAIKKVLASLYKQLEFWKVADMKNFDVAEAWLKEQLGGHHSEWQKQLEVAEKWVERSKPKQQTKEKSAKFADREPSKPERPAYVRGRLRRAAAFWTRICHSSVVLAWIMQGYMIQWAAFPPQPFVADNLSGAVTHADWVSQQIWDLQCKGSVVPVSMVPTVFRAVQAKILADIKAAGFSLSEPKLKLDPSQGWGGYTVSSSSGFKAQVAVGMDEFLTDHRSQIAQGYLSPSEQLESSTWRELIAIERVLLSLGHLLAGKVARLFTDNQAVTFFWAKARAVHDVLPALSNGVLNTASDPQLVELYDQVPSVLAAAKATSTWKRYTPMWDRFKQWCQGFGVSFLPAEPLIVALYLLMLMQIAGSFNTIKEAAKRVLHAGVNKKEPLTWDAVVQIAQKALEPAATLKQLLIATIISVGFCGFFRYDDLSNITVDLVVIYRSHMEEGKEVYGAQPISYSCLRGMLLAAIADIGLPVEAFGTHSLRAGGATLAANQDHTAQQRGRPNSEDTGSHTAQPHTSSLVPLVLSGVPSTRIEECLAWLAGHTHFDPAQTTAALRSLTHGASSLPRHSYGLPPLTAADLADRADGAQCTAALARQRQRPAIPPGFEPRAATVPGAQEQEQDGGLARKAALSAMTCPRQPTLRLLSLNVNGLQDKDKRRWLFNLLERDKWDVILLQETHHRSPEEGAAWAQEGPNGLRCNWSGPAFWCHYTSQSRGVAILFRATATTSNLTLRHSSATGRTLSVDFTFSGLPYTAVCVYAPSVATDRPHYCTQELLPSLPPDRHLLGGGDFNCIAGQQDMLDSASPTGQRTLGYWTGLRHVETDHSLYDVWRDLNSDRRAFTHIATSGQSAARLDRWLISEQLRARVSKEPHAIGHVIGYPEAVPAYLGAHPLGPDLTRGRRWEDLKRQVKDISLQRSWALAAQQRASLKVLEADSRAAMAAYSRSPSADILLAWQDAYQLLQALNAEAAKGAALHAGVVWQFYGEQSTFWFHHLARDRQSRTELTVLCCRQ